MTDNQEPSAADMAAASQTEKLEKLRFALEEFTRRQEAGEAGSLFDHEAEEKKAEVRRRALLLLDQRARSRSELRQRLTSLEFDPEVIDEVIEDLTRAKLLDDEDLPGNGSVNVPNDEGNPPVHLTRSSARKVWIPTPAWWPWSRSTPTMKVLSIFL